MTTRCFLRFPSALAAESAKALIEQNRDLLPEGTWFGRGNNLLFFRTEGSEKDLQRALVRITTGTEVSERDLQRFLTSISTER